MNDTEVTKTIEQMVRFIRQEAEEKANEIAVSTEEEFNISRLQMVEAEKKRVKTEFERRESAIDVKKKVEKSKRLNETRLKVLQAREDAVQAVLSEAQDELAAITKDKNRYKALLADLLVQGFDKLREPKLLVRCRQVDEELVQAAIKPAVDRYKKQAGLVELDVSVDKQHYLAPPPNGKKADESNTCSGGVAITTADGSIVCSNTLDDRLEIVYSQNLPSIRAVLFGEAN